MRYARRLIAAVLALAVLDQFVPGVLARAEYRRYEGTAAFRFHDSDLFGLGPFVSYLRDHPHGDRPRTVFLGNSVLFGLDLSASDAVPGQFQQRHPGTQVFNAAINGLDLGSNYLIAKAIIESVDAIYVMRGSAAVHPLVPQLIPVDFEKDGPAFHLQPPDGVETRLQSLASVWHLYDSSYRLQAALFGTATRQFLHLLVRPQVAMPHASGDGAVVVARSRAAAAPADARRQDLRTQDETLWTLAELVASRRKRAVILQIGQPAPGALGEPAIAEFNAAFAPFVEIVTLTIPPSLTFDGHHVTAKGARALAEALP